MLSSKIKDFLDEYVSQEVYVQVAVAKEKTKLQPKQQFINILKAITLKN